MPPGKTSAASEGQAVSSRKLRKRELDRNAQRNARERTKNRIAYLERLVEDLQNASAGERVARLMEQLSDVTRERDDLSKALKTIENVLKTTKASGGIEDIPLQGPPRSRSESDAKTDSSPEAIPYITDALDSGSSPEEFSKEEGSEDVIIPRAPECDCSADKAVSMPPRELNRWRFANEVLSGRPKLPQHVLLMEDATAEDTPIRAMIEGWEAVEASGRLPPLWQNLRRIDEVIFPTCSKVERLAIMRLMHLLYRYHAGPTPERKADLPAWYLSRPSQESIAHSYAINFFAWPGLRERFIFSQHRYCSNVFWRLFAQNAVMLWPFEFRDCYTYNLETGQYALSTAFEKNIRDLNCWTMKGAMYERWPEMRNDIPAYFDNEVPVSLPDPVIEQGVNEQQENSVDRRANVDEWMTSSTAASWALEFPFNTLQDDQPFDNISFAPIGPEFPFVVFTQGQQQTRMAV